MNPHPQIDALRQAAHEALALSFGAYLRYQHHAEGQKQ